MTFRRMQILCESMSPEKFQQVLHDEINMIVGRELLLSNGGMPPRCAPPEPLIMTPEEEKAHEEYMALLRERDR
jgi:hypothetical protein